MEEINVALTALLTKRASLAKQLEGFRQERDTLAASVEDTNVKIHALGKQIKELQPEFGSVERNLDILLQSCPNVKLELDRSTRPHACCREVSNLDIRKLDDDKFVEKCRTCGCRHFSMTVDPVVVGLQGAAIGK